MCELDDLAVKYQTDKGSVSVGTLPGKCYTPYYEEMFSAIREDPLRILEIGIHKGASLKMWYDYFPNSKIYGIDINSKCLQYENDRTKVFIGDQADVPFLESVAQEMKYIDIAIDDGAHRTKQQMTSFDTLFPHMCPGGFYVIEDVYVLRSRAQYADENDTIQQFLDKITYLMTTKIQDLSSGIDSIKFIRPATEGAMIVITKGLL